MPGWHCLALHGNRRDAEVHALAVELLANSRGDAHRLWGHDAGRQNLVLSSLQHIKIPGLGPRTFESSALATRAAWLSSGRAGAQIRRTAICRNERAGIDFQHDQRLSGACALWSRRSAWVVIFHLANGAGSGWIFCDSRASLRAPTRGARCIRLECGESPLWVKTRNARYEQISSALPTIADLATSQVQEFNFIPGSHLRNCGGARNFPPE